jgi:hypothetical protein
VSKSPTAFKHRTNGRFRFAQSFLSALLVLAMLWAAGPFAFAQSEIEFKVKAAFLFNFAKFTEWPPAKLGANDPFVIGCFSDPEFMEVLEATVAGKTFGSRRIVVKRITGADDLRACHMLFIGRTKDDNATALLARAREMHVLSVGEVDGFTNRGGMIGFVRADGSVKFAINPQQAERAGLTLSSKLLGLAVNEREGARR